MNQAHKTRRQLAKKLITRTKRACAKKPRKLSAQPHNLSTASLTLLSSSAAAHLSYHQILASVRAGSKGSKQVFKVLWPSATHKTYRRSFGPLTK